MFRLVGSAILLIVSVASATNFIELDDTNRNKLPLEIGKELDVIQKAMKIDYKLERMDDVRKFLDNCEDLNSKVSRANDNEWEGLALQIKEILSDSKLIEMCSVTHEEIEVFNLFDNKETPIIYYKDRHLKEYIDFKEKLFAKPKLFALLGHMYETRTHLMGEELLKFSSHLTETLNGEKALSFITPKYKSECAITKIKPICKFAQASGTDFAGLKASLEVMDEEKLNQDEVSIESEVTVATVKRSCKSLEGELMPFLKVDTYKELGFLTEEQIAAYCKADSKFNFYYQLYQMCNVFKH